MLLSMRENLPWASSIVKFFRFIGKWSMVDIFVVATFLVYLAGGSSDVSRGEFRSRALYIFMLCIPLGSSELSAEKMLEVK